MTEDELMPLLKSGVTQLNIPLNQDTLEKILVYIDFLAHWNKTYNLTAILDKRDMIIKHALDSLSLYPFLHGKRCIDIGTGPGLPGFMLALALPEIQFVLLDSQIKKTQFIRRVLREIPLDNVEVCHQRVEDHKPAILYDIIISRAFASLTDMIRCSAHLRAEKGYYCAMKGVFPKEEITSIEKDYVVGAAPRGCPFKIEVKTVNVPFLEGERHVVIVQDLCLFQ